MDFEVKRKKILDVAEKHKLCVISTADRSGRPESALIGYYLLPSMEIVFGTFINFRKYKNLQVNPYVAFVIGWENDDTVQLEGIATELIGQELTEMQDKFLQKFPKSAKYLHHSEERLFKVLPTWLRYTSLKSEPEEVFEIRF